MGCTRPDRDEVLHVARAQNLPHGNLRHCSPPHTQQAAAPLEVAVASLELRLALSPVGSSVATEEECQHRIAAGKEALGKAEVGETSPAKLCSMLCRKNMKPQAQLRPAAVADTAKLHGLANRVQHRCGDAWPRTPAPPQGLLGRRLCLRYLQQSFRCNYCEGQR